jgi:transcriptional regulator with XRE-family HTH domain
MQRGIVLNEPEYPPCAQHLVALRERRGLTKGQVAERLGLPSHWLDDLEAYDQELYANIALRHLSELARALGVSVADILVAGTGAGAGERLPFAQVPDRLRAVLAGGAESVEAFGQRVGWEVDRVLDNPADMWGWCPDELRDISRGLGIDWVAALPGPADRPPPAHQTGE